MSDANQNREQEQAPESPTKEQRRALRAAAAAEARYILSMRAS
jgi:hypothetical protein